MLEWKVLVSDFNGKEINEYNVFDHMRFYEDCKKNARKNIHNYDEFCKNLRIDLAYYFWAKCEWEIIVTDWPRGEKSIKIDVYEQVMLNWDHFCDYVWSHGAELRRREKKLSCGIRNNIQQKESEDE